MARYMSWVVWVTVMWVGVTVFTSGVSTEDHCQKQPCGHGNCTEIAGSVKVPYYKCVCDSGYKVINETTYPTCADVDECKQDNGGCQQVCINVEGGHQCSCFPGYSLQRNFCASSKSQHYVVGIMMSLIILTCLTGLTYGLIAYFKNNKRSGQRWRSRSGHGYERLTTNIDEEEDLELSFNRQPHQA